MFYKSKQIGHRQKESPEMFFKKLCFQKFCKINRKTPVSESLFNKVVRPRPATLL